MEFHKLINRAMDLRSQYEKKEKQLYGAPSSGEDLARGFAGDVNNLVRLIAAKPGRHENIDRTEKIGAQLSHSLWSIIVLARLYDIELEQAFMETMDRLENHLLETQE